MISWPLLVAAEVPTPDFEPARLTCNTAVSLCFPVHRQRSLQWSVPQHHERLVFRYHATVHQVSWSRRLLLASEGCKLTNTYFARRNDPRLYKDDVDIRFSRTLNSCKLPQIRYASPERLFERLTDLRFLSIDFLNTFLLTYRVFTDGVTVLEALKKVHYSPESQLSSMISPLHDSSGSLEEINCKNDTQQQQGDVFDYVFSRRISATSVISDISDAHRESVVSASSDTQLLQNLQQAQNQISARNNQHWRLSYRKCEYHWELQSTLFTTVPCNESSKSWRFESRGRPDLLAKGNYFDTSLILCSLQSNCKS